MADTVSKRDRQQSSGDTDLMHAFQQLGHGGGNGGRATHQEVVQTLNVLHHLASHQQV